MSFDRVHTSDHTTVVDLRRIIKWSYWHGLAGVRPSCIADVLVQLRAPPDCAEDAVLTLVSAGNGVFR